MVWALQFNDSSMTLGTPVPAIGGRTNVEVRLQFKIDTLNGTFRRLVNNSETNDLNANTWKLGISSGNQLIVQVDDINIMLLNVSVDTFYDLRVVHTGLNPSADAITTNGCEVFLNGVSQGTMDCRSNPWRNVGGMMNMGGLQKDNPDRVDQNFIGQIYQLDIIYDGTTATWSATASDRSNTGLPPVFASSTANEGWAASLSSNFPTDGSAFVDIAGGADTTAPVWTVDPAVSATSDSGHSFDFTVTDDSSIIGYGIRVSSGATPAPTAAQVIAGTDGNGTDLTGTNAYWTSTLTSGVSATATFTGGAVSTEYDYYFAVEDSAGNDSLLKSVTATTGAGAIAIDTDTLTAGAAFTGTYSGIGSLASPITLTDSNANSITVAITDNLNGTFSGTMPALPSSGSASSILFGTVTVSGAP